MTFAGMYGALVGCFRRVVKFEAMDLEIASLAEVICCIVIVCLPVRMIFPFAVHLAEENWMFR